MKLLPKKEVDKTKIEEKRLQIDQGLNFAKRIDALRESYQTEKKRLEDFRQEEVKIVNYEIGQLREERDNLARQNTEARKRRDELLKEVEQIQILLEEIKNG